MASPFDSLIAAVGNPYTQPYVAPSGSYGAGTYGSGGTSAADFSSVLSQSMATPADQVAPNQTQTNPADATNTFNQTNNADQANQSNQQQSDTTDNSSTQANTPAQPSASDQQLANTAALNAALASVESFLPYFALPTTNMNGLTTLGQQTNTAAATAAAATATGGAGTAGRLPSTARARGAAGADQMLAAQMAAQQLGLTGTPLALALQVPVILNPALEQFGIASQLAQEIGQGAAGIFPRPFGQFSLTANQGLPQANATNSNGTRGLTSQALAALAAQNGVNAPGAAANQAAQAAARAAIAPAPTAAAQPAPAANALPAVPLGPTVNPVTALNPSNVPAQTPIVTGANPAVPGPNVPPGGGLSPTTVKATDAIAAPPLAVNQGRPQFQEERVAVLSDTLNLGQGGPGAQQGMDFGAVLRNAAASGPAEVGQQRERVERAADSAGATVAVTVPGSVQPTADAARPQPTTAPAQAATPAPPANQVADGIVTHAHVLTRNGQTDFQIRLDPPDLGQVQVRLQSSGDTVRAQVVVSSEAVRHMIESQLPELRQRLEAAGVFVNHFDVTQDSGGGGGFQQQDRSAPQYSGASRASTPAPVASPADRPRATGGRTSALDVTV